MNNKKKTKQTYKEIFILFLIDILIVIIHYWHECKPLCYYFWKHASKNLFKYWAKLVNEKLLVNTCDKNLWNYMNKPYHNQITMATALLLDTFSLGASIARRKIVSYIYCSTLNLEKLLEMYVERTQVCDYHMFIFNVWKN